MTNLNHFCEFAFHAQEESITNNSLHAPLTKEIREATNKTQLTINHPQNQLTMDKGQPAAKAPTMTDLEEGKTYAWCACGKSNNQPWCNGAHSDTNLNPTVFKAENSQKAAMCMCKQTSNPPYCDGSHARL